MSSVTVLVQKCQGLLALWDAPRGGRGCTESLNQLDQSVAHLTNVLCNLKLGSQGSEGSSNGSSTQAAPTHQDVLDAVEDVQQHVRAATAEFGRMKQLGAELVKYLAELAALVQQQQLDMQRQQVDVAKQKEELAGFKFLANYGDYISDFRMLLARRVSAAYPDVDNSWEQLSYFLRQEEREQESGEGEVTQETKQQLQAMGFNWSEWSQLRDVADAATSVMHTRKQGSIQATLEQLDVQAMPQGLEHTQATLKKALVFIQSARLAPKRAVK